MVAPESTLDFDTPDGESIPIEDRDGNEVVTVRNATTAPENTRAANPGLRHNARLADHRDRHRPAGGSSG